MPTEYDNTERHHALIKEAQMHSTYILQLVSIWPPVPPQGITHNQGISCDLVLMKAHLPVEGDPAKGAKGASPWSGLAAGDSETEEGPFSPFYSGLGYLALAR